MLVQLCTFLESFIKKISLVPSFTKDSIRLVYQTRTRLLQVVIYSESKISRGTL